MELIFLVGALTDIQDAFSRAEGFREGGGSALTAALERTLELLKTHPELGPVYEHPFRRLIVRRSFLALYYSITPKRIVIQAVLDMRRDRTWTRSRPFGL